MRTTLLLAAAALMAVAAPAFAADAAPLHTERIDTVAADSGSCDINTITTTARELDFAGATFTVTLLRDDDALPPLDDLSIDDGADLLTDTESIGGAMQNLTSSIDGRARFGAG